MVKENNNKHHFKYILQKADKEKELSREDCQLLSDTQLFHTRTLFLYGLPLTEASTLIVSLGRIDWPEILWETLVKTLRFPCLSA